MYHFAQWIGKRLVCSILGHRLESARVFHHHAKTMTNGYRCTRCGRSQLHAYIWQRTVDDE